MTAAGPWSVKGIDPKAREIAKDLARRSGLTLGEWLNQMIIEGGDVEADAPSPPTEPRRPLDALYREAQVRRMAAETRAPDENEAQRLTRALETLATRVEAAEQRSVLAISGMDQSVMGVLSRLDEIEREAGGRRLEGSVDEVRAAQSRLAERLRRLEGEGGPRAEGLKALEAALGRMAMRMDEEAARAEEARQETRDAAEMSRGVGQRLERLETVLEAAPAAYADAEKVEIVLTRMAERLDQTETRATAAVQSLQTSFAGLDARLRGNEARVVGYNGADMERRFQSLAQELSQRVEASRVELAQRIRAAADVRADKMEAALRDLGGHVEQAEKRSAQAIDRIGREVLRVAHGLGERVASTETRLSDVAEQTGERLGAVEARSAAAMEAMSGQVSRLADTMSDRLRGADTAQAEALEKLGGEIARIAERLAERISTSERRSADAIDEVSDKVARIGASFEARDVSGTDLAERIQASEERTAKLLDEARERLDQRLADMRSLPTPALPAAAPAYDSAPSPTGANADPFASPPVAAPVEIEDGFSRPASPGASDAFEAPDPFRRAAAFADPEPFADAEPVPAAEHSDPSRHGSPFGDDEDLASASWPTAAAEPLAPLAEAEPMFAPARFEDPPVASAENAPFLGFSVGDFAPAPEPSERPEASSTREMLEAARSAVRRAAAGRRGEPGSIDSVPVPPLEPVGQAAPRPFGITLPGRRRKEGAPTLRTLALASVTAGAITTMGVGAYLLGGANHDGGKASPEVALVDPPTAAPPIIPAAATQAPPSLAVALTSPSAAQPAPLDPASKPPAAKPKADAARSAAPATPTPPTTSPKTSAKALYASAVGRLDNGDLTALADLKTAADQGSPQAQFYLARLYEAGAAGLKKDLGEARRWTARAAETGDPSAMYNLASYMYAGDGGAKDPTGAAQWFRRAAEHGVVNGQYNLAQLYEKGYGVPLNNAEAYKWYLVAAGAGDTEAKAAADSLKDKMTPDALAAAEHAAAQLHAQLAGGPVKTAAATP